MLHKVSKFLCTFFMLSALTGAAQEEEHHHHHHMQEEAQQPDSSSTNHQEHQHAGHGMVLPEFKHFPTIAYDEKLKPRLPQLKAAMAIHGDPELGKKFAYQSDKGRCLNCHVLGPDGEQPGTVGPNLSAYALRKINPAVTFQQIWDARVHNPNTVMPAFGTYDLLTKEEVAHIVAYLQTLKTPVDTPADLAYSVRGVWVVGEDLTLDETYLEEGKRLFERAGANGGSCVSCHTVGGKGPDLKEVGASYPKWNKQQKRVLLLEQRINLCRSQFMDSPHYPLGSAESNQLTSYLKSLSRHLPIRVAKDAPTTAAIARGKASFQHRAGQLNFACATCHTTDQPVVGRWLRGEVTHSFADSDKIYVAAQWPKHFVGGHDQGLQSLQQRIEHCQAVTNTHPLRLGSPEYVELELYLTSLSKGMPLLAPTLSRLRGE